MLPKTKPADEDVLDWWDKTIEMCTKRADGIEMCIDDLATAIREQRQTSQGLGLSLEMERNSISERLLTDKDALALLSTAGWLSPTEAAQLRTRVMELETALAGHRELDQTYALTDVEKRAAELEADAANWRKVEAMPMNFRLAHEPVSAFPGDDDWDTKRHYEWAVLYHSTFTSNGATPREALDRAMNNPQRWVPDFVLTMWREAYLAALEAAGLPPEGTMVVEKEKK